MSERAAYLLAACWWIAFCAFAVITVAAAVALNRPQKPKEVWHIETCSGCGTEWRSRDPMQQIKKCPQCRMSMEEFELLKESVRNRHKQDAKE